MPPGKYPTKERLCRPRSGRQPWGRAPDGSDSSVQGAGALGSNGVDPPRPAKSGQGGPPGQPQGQDEAEADEGSQQKAEEQFLPSPSLDGGKRQFGQAEAGDQEADAGNDQTHDAGRHHGHLVGPGDEAEIHRPLMLSVKAMPAKKRGQGQGVLPATETGGGEGEEGGRDKVSKDKANSPDQATRPGWAAWRGSRPSRRP